MREETLRTILLAKAIEETDPGGQLIPLADREAATHEALRETGGKQDPGEALAARARRLLLPLAQRHPTLGHMALPAVVPAWLMLAIVAAAFVSGLGLAALDGSRRINILALPILGVVAWNLLVYAFLGWRAFRKRSHASAGRDPQGASWLGDWLGRRLQRFIERSATFASPVSDALVRFATDLGHATVPLFLGVLRRSMHLAAASVALGMAAGFYLRGIVLRFEAGWESTFLGSSQALAAINVLYAPVSGWAGGVLPGTTAEVEALRWTAAGGGGDAAPWIHLIALSLVLYVVVPRLVLAAAASFDVLRLRRSVALPAPLPARRRSRARCCAATSVKSAMRPTSRPR